jgi:hypothetical protein
MLGDCGSLPHSSAIKAVPLIVVTATATAKAAALAGHARRALGAIPVQPAPTTTVEPAEGVPAGPVATVVVVAVAAAAAATDPHPSLSM